MNSTNKSELPLPPVPAPLHPQSPPSIFGRPSRWTNEEQPPEAADAGLRRGYRVTGSRTVTVFGEGINRLVALMDSRDDPTLDRLLSSTRQQHQTIAATCQAIAAIVSAVH